MPFTVAALKDRLASAASIPGEEGNCIDNVVWKVARAHDDSSGELNSGFVRVVGGVRQAAPTENRLVAPLPALGCADNVSPVMSPANCGAPVLSKITASTVCAAASRYARSTNDESVPEGVRSTNSNAFQLSFPFAVVTVSV